MEMASLHTKPWQCTLPGFSHIPSQACREQVNATHMRNRHACRQRIVRGPLNAVKGKQALSLSLLSINVSPGCSSTASASLPISLSPSLPLALCLFLSCLLCRIMQTPL